MALCSAYVIYHTGSPHRKFQLCFGAQLCFCVPVLLGVSQLCVKTFHQVYSELLCCDVIIPACDLGVDFPL